MEKVNSVQDQMDNFNREMVTVGNNQMKMLEMLNSYKMKNSLDGLIILVTQCYTVRKETGR